ncbi:MAG: hypothetical protein ACT4QF_04380 [Sporichthyaceae bacterium]
MPARSLRVVALGLLLATAIGVGDPSASAAPPDGRGEGARIEAPAQYQPQFLCSTTTQPGVAAFRSLVLKAYPKTGSAGGVRSCDPGRTSEHQDGRAWDWRVSVKNSAERRAADSLVAWLLAPDEFGNDFAQARRLGIMYLIWNKKVWRAYRGGWGDYSCSGVTSCHQDHVHFSFGWAGAKKKTSYWTGRVSPQLPPPIPLLDAAGEELRTTVAANGPQVYGAKSVVGGLPYSVRATGTWRYGTSEYQKADAACRRGKDGVWRRARALRVSGMWTLTPTTDTGRGCNTVDHTYVATLAPRASDAIAFVLAHDDGKRTNDSGSVKVLVRRLF